MFACGSVRVTLSMQSHIISILQQSNWPRGRVLGGTSQINANVYVRGHRHDYDNWAANDCEGWSYQDVLPYFKKSENNRVDGLQAGKDYIY